MNILYDQMFNPQYVNDAYLQQLQYQQYDTMQKMEIQKAVKAIHDYGEAVRKIDPDYREMAFWACAATVLEEMRKM